MDLILKPTVKCNFACTFCSSTVLSEQPNDELDLVYVDRFLQRFPGTRTIIVNGGDPLMMSPQYYWDILALLERHKSKAIISLTTNLWAFYKKPEKWEALFRHPQVGVATSFQYGDARLKGDLTPFTESEFWAVSDLFLDRVGYRPEFIAVIDRSNEDSVLRTVELAKTMDVVCKINHAVASGPQVVKRGVTMGNEDKFFTQADIYEHYIRIWEAGLAEWEYNTQQMARRLAQGNTTCPLSRDCDTGIRTLQPDGSYYSCGAFGDDRTHSIDFDYEMQGGLARPLSSDPDLSSMKLACYACPMFSICNGCRKTVHDTKRLGLVEYHCRKMKALAPEIIRINGMEAFLEPTPYEDETPQLIAKA